MRVAEFMATAARTTPKACGVDVIETIVLVTGPIETSELGPTLVHEHVTCADWSMRMNFGEAG